MTELELEALRDDLININNTLDSLNTRVTTLENLAVPKGSYFNQLKASFEGSPECCDCTDTVEVDCMCDVATPSIYLVNDGDELTFRDAIYTVNGVEYTNETIDTVLDVQSALGYVFDSITEDYVSTIYYKVFSLQAGTTADVCVEITNTRDQYTNPATFMEELVIPYPNGESFWVYKRTYNFSGDDLDTEINPSFVKIITGDLVKVRFCLHQSLD